MKMNHSDILFGLYMNGGKGNLDWLATFLCGGVEPGAGEIREIKDTLSLMSAFDLVESTWQEGQGVFTLTQAGERAALAAADVISHQMVEQWRETYVA